MKDVNVRKGIMSSVEGGKKKKINKFLGKSAPAHRAMEKSLRETY